MGIPYYFYSLTKKYQNILDNNKPARTDIYCIDFNGIIHTVAQQILKDKRTESMKTEEIDELILENEFYAIKIHPSGAELHSVYSKKINREI